MPQIKLEYTENLQAIKSASDIFNKIHQILFKEAVIAIENCKSRAVIVDDYFVGTGDNNMAFAHLEIAIFKGRSSELKEKIGKLALAELKKGLACKENKTEMQFTVEIRDINKSSYFKTSSKN